MKKIKNIVAAIIRGALLLAPGTAFAIWQWGKVSALINVLASIGVEMLYLLVFAFIVAIMHVARDESGKPDKALENDESEMTE